MSDEKTSAQQQFELDFEAFLRDDASQLAEMYRKLPLAAPDAELDARVRALAQRELALADDDNADGAPGDAEDANLTPTRMYLRHPRWLPALAAAATLVLAAGLAWRMGPSSWTSRKRANVPVAAAPAVSTHAEQKAKVESGSADRALNAADKVAVQKPTAPPASTAAAQPNQPGALAKMAPAAPRTKSASDTERPEPEPQAFPVAAAPIEAERRQQEKVESAAQVVTSASPAPPPRPPAPPALAAPVPAPAAEAAPAVAQSARADAAAMKQAAPQNAAAAGSAPYDAARAPKSAIAPPASVAGNLQSSTSTCPAAQDGNDWRGHYPPEIPPTPLLRRQTVKDLIGQAHREEARRAYADFHARCPGDAWPPDILNQLGNL